MKTINGTSYHDDTCAEVVRVLEDCRMNGTRIVVSYGDTVTGRDWLDEHGATGRISRSTGTSRVPLLVATSRSLGGGAILDHCIVRIRESTGGKILYRHPTYHFGCIVIQTKAEPVSLPDGRLLRYDLLRDGQVHASFRSLEQSLRWVKKMGIVAEIRP